MANEFIVRNGLVALADSQITGSLSVSGAITGSGAGLTNIPSSGLNAPGSTTQILYNSGGNLAASSGLVYSGSNVGIGNTNPLAPLDVNGNIYSSGNLLVDRIFSRGGSTDLYLDGRAGYGVNVRSGSTSIAYFDYDTANVGIGTTAPSAKLHVSGTSDVLLIEGSGSTIFDVQGSQGQLFSVTDSLVGSLFSVNDISGLPIIEVFDTDKVVMGTFGQNTLVVTGSKVGIGTDTPTYGDLDVRGPVYIGDSAQIVGTIFHRNNIQILNAAANGFNTWATRVNGEVDLSYIRNITTSGSIGIGTTNPIMGLHIEDSKGFVVGQTTTGASIYISPTNENTINSNYGFAADGSDFWINYRGYQDGFTYFRNTKIGDGKGNAIITITGATGNTSMTGDLTVDGIVTAKEFHTEFVSASIIYQSGSTKFGDTADDVHQFTGSISLSGSTYINNPNGTSKLIVGESPNSEVNAVVLESNGAGNNTQIYSTGTSNHMNISAIGNNSDIYLSSNHDITFRTNNGGNKAGGSDRLFISQSGDIGIGTTSPAEKLTVEGNISASGNINTTGAVKLDGQDGLWLNQGGSSVFSPSPGIFYSGIAGQGWYFQVPDNGQEKFSFKLGNTSAGREFRVVDPSWNPLFQVQGTGDAIIANNLTVGGIVTAKEFHTEFVSASIIYQSGSTKFGDTPDDIHQFTGSLDASGSYEINNNQVLYDINGTGDIYANIRVLRNLHQNDGMYIGYANGGGGNGHLRFYASGTTERMRIDASTGNVGIGTTNPLYKLHVAGEGLFQSDIIISGSSPAIKFNEVGQATNEAYLGIGGQKMTIYTGRTGTSRNDLWLRVGDSANSSTPTIFASGSTGYVGIGNEAPARRLHIGGAGGSGGGIMLSPSSGDIEIQFQDSGTTNAYITLKDGTQQMRFRDDSANVLNVDFGTERVGINTTSPTVALQVEGDVSASYFYGDGSGLTNVTTTAPALQEVLNSGNSAGGVGIEMQGGGIDMGAGDITGAGHISGSTMQLGSTAYIMGNVGIGTTSPERLLSLYSNNTETTPRLLIEQEGTGDAVMAFSLVGGQGWSMGIDNSLADAFMIHNSAGGVDSSSQLVILPNGNVGIGQSTPTSRLHITNNVTTTEADIPQSFAVQVDSDHSGTDTATGDREQGGIYIDVDSSTTGGDLSNEHRLYGIYADVRATGDPDSLVGGNFNTEYNGTTGTLTAQYGIIGSAISDVSDGSITTTYIGGTYGSLSLQDAGPITNAYGVRGYVGVYTNRTGDITNIAGGEFEVQLDQTTPITITNVYGVKSVIDVNQPYTSSGAYLFYGDYTGTTYADVRYGVYIADAVDNYFSGNVGVGVGSPQAKLHVNYGSGGSDIVFSANNKVIVAGDGTLRWGGAADYGKLTWDTGKAVVRGESGKALSLGANGNQDYLYISTSGNVGIGTTAPGYKLDVKSGGANTFFTSFTPSAGSGFIRMYQDSNNHLAIYGANASGTTNIVLATNGVSYLKGGNVIIGGSADNGNTLQVQGNSYVAGDLTVSGIVTAQEFHTEFVSASIVYQSGSTKFGDTSDDVHSFTGSLNIQGDIRTKNSGRLYLWNDNNSNYLNYITWLASSGTTQTIQNTGIGGITFKTLTDTRMYISASGNIGIGTSAPSNQLHVTGNARMAQLLLGDSDASNIPAVALHIKSSGTNARMRIEDSDNANKYYDFLVDEGRGLYINEDTSTVFFIEEGGNVGINNTSPNYTLDVTGEVGATSFIETSARRFKENIEPIQGSLEIVEQLQGVTFNRIGEEKREYGFIADEVKDVAPELVSYDENGEVHGVHYARTVAVLTEAVKELNGRVKAQDLFIKDLVARIEKLENN